MAKVKIKIDGLDRLVKNITGHEKVVNTNLKIAINNSIDRIEAKAIPITPVKTGLLVRSYAKGRQYATNSNLKGQVMPNAKYAKSVSSKKPQGVRYTNPSKNRFAVGGFVQEGKDRAESGIDKEFKNAVARITKELTK